MIYYQDEELVIRAMEEADAQIFNDEYTAQGWHPDVAYYHMRMQEAAEGKCVALTAVYRGEPAGALYLYRYANEGPFKGRNWPYVVDLGVLKKYQHCGIGNRLMAVAEQLAARSADAICLGVGLSREYGTAQRMYAKRGYVPDGSGVWYKDRQCVQYETVCTVDDDLILYLSKTLRG